MGCFTDGQQALGILLTTVVEDLQQAKHVLSTKDTIKKTKAQSHAARWDYHYLTPKT